MSQVDAGASALVRDLKDRGLLDDTLIVWMGEFGRTPRINSNAGRDHYAKAWTTMLQGRKQTDVEAMARRLHQEYPEQYADLADCRQEVLDMLQLAEALG